MKIYFQYKKIDKPLSYGFVRIKKDEKLTGHYGVKVSKNQGEIQKAQNSAKYLGNIQKACFCAGISYFQNLDFLHPFFYSFFGFLNYKII